MYYQVVKPNAEISSYIVAPSDRLQPSNHWGLEVLFILYVTHPMPAGGGRNRDCNRSRYYYLVWELFKWLFLLYHLINPSEVRAVQDVVSSSWWNTRTYIQPSIRIHLRKPAGSSRVTSRPFAVSTTQGRPGRSWCWRPKSQAWLRLASRLSHRSPRLLQWLSFVEREDSPLAPPPSDRERRWSASNLYKLVLKYSTWSATAHKRYVGLFLQKKLSVDESIDDRVFVMVAREVRSWQWGI